MQTVLRKMGNSTGIILPKAMLGELGMATGQAVDLRIEEGRIVATPIRPAQRANWADAARIIAGQPDREAEDWLQAGHEGDDALTW